jgi:hypothetical protein
MNGVPDRRKLVPPHLADSVLLAHLDGELPRAESENARVHLESCWSCRRRLGVLETSIGYYLDQRAPLQPQLQLEGEQRVRQFRERLARHALASEPTFGETLHAYWEVLTVAILAHRRMVLASVVAVGLLVTMFTDVIGTRVSADTILNRAQTFESMERPNTGQVKRVALRFDRIQHKSGIAEPLATVTILDDAEQTRAYLVSESSSGNPEPVVLTSRHDAVVASQPSLLSEDWPVALASYLHSQHWLPAITAEAFRQLTAGRGVTASSVQKEPDAFVLIYPFAEGHPSGVSEARLRVDRRTFATMGLSLFLGSQTDGIEYRFTRVETSIEPRTAEIARLFSPHDAVHPNRNLTTREPARATPLSYAATQATDEEVRLNNALHQSDACLGDEIHVFPMSDGSLLVQGLVDKAERRDAVRNALRAADPAAPTQIFLPQELRSSSQLFSLPYQAPLLPAAQRSDSGTNPGEMSSQRIPLYEQLFHHFERPGASPESTEEQINAFSDEAVNLSRQTFLHAWALKKLDLEFSAERSAGLSSTAIQQLERMRQDHRRRIAAISRRQSEMLARVGAPNPPSLGSNPADSLDTDTLLRLAREQNDLVRSLFTVSNSPSETGASVSRLIDILHRIGA